MWLNVKAWNDKGSTYNGLFLLVIKPCKGNFAAATRRGFYSSRRTAAGSIGAQGAMGTRGLVVKYLDPSETDISEGTWLLCFH